MIKQEKRITNVEKRVDSLEAVFKSFMSEMRDRDNQRAAEIMEMRQKHDADMKEMRAGLDSMGKHVRNLSVAAMAAVGGMFVAVGVMVGTLIYTLLKH